MLRQVLKGGLDGLRGLGANDGDVGDIVLFEVGLEGGWRGKVVSPQGDIGLIFVCSRMLRIDIIIVTASSSISSLPLIHTSPIPSRKNSGIHRRSVHQLPQGAQNLATGIPLHEPMGGPIADFFVEASQRAVEAVFAVQAFVAGWESEAKEED